MERKITQAQGEKYRFRTKGKQTSICGSLMQHWKQEDDEITSSNTENCVTRGYPVKIALMYQRERNNL